MLKFELVSFYRHRYDSAWSFDLLLIEKDFEFDDSRSLFGIGKKDDTWFFDLFWIKIAPRG